MLTITQLARTCSTSRATILYYEKKGLLEPATRTENGYRWYGNNEIKSLEKIIAYRSFGLPIAKLSLLLKKKNNVIQEQILSDHFTVIEKEITALRVQQKAIIQFLNQPILLEKKMVTKERWVEIMKAAGFSEQDMLNWHKKFESMEPDEHQKFLQSLQISESEIKKIRSF